MTIRGLTARLITGVFILAMVQPAFSAERRRAVAPWLKPNFVIVMTDDQDPESVAFMPRVQSLLQQNGATFENFIISYSWCCPSRASILRGQYAHNHGVMSNTLDPYLNWPSGGGERGFRMRGLDQSTLATWLHDAGYTTALIGKYLNEYGFDHAAYIPPGWDFWYAEWCPKSTYACSMNVNGAIQRYQKYFTDELSDAATSFISTSVVAGKPFFVMITPDAPHEPAIPADKYKEWFSAVVYPKRPSFNEEDVSDKVTWIQGLPLLNENDIADIDEYYRQRLRTLQSVDDMVGRLVGQLEHLGVIENTFFIFLSDNGYHMGEHRLPNGKTLAYEEDIHVPFIIRGPGIPAGQTVKQLVANIDLAPTIADWAHIQVPAFVDGRSFTTLAGGHVPSKWRKWVLIERDIQASLRGMRGETSTWIENACCPNNFTEYYDLQRDPYQIDNRSRDLSSADRKALSSFLGRLQACAGPTCRSIEDEDLTVVLPKGGTSH